jgi:hypothetical protein
MSDSTSDRTFLGRIIAGGNRLENRILNYEARLHRDTLRNVDATPKQIARAEEKLAAIAARQEVLSTNL